MAEIYRCLKLAENLNAMLGSRFKSDKFPSRPVAINLTWSIAAIQILSFIYFTLDWFIQPNWYSHGVKSSTASLNPDTSYS